MYESRLRDLVASSARWLDIGCGHQVLQPWRFESERGIVASAQDVVGLDLEIDALTRHRTIRKRVSGNLDRLPFADASFDLVTANMVLEHLENPAGPLTEIARVLKPGGVMLALTPNLMGYQAMLARCIPEWGKRRLVKVLQARASHDVFPAYYRINTDAAIKRVAAVSGFGQASVEHVSTEAQCIVLPPLLIPELLLIRALMSDRLRRLRPNLIAVLHKAA